MKKYGIGKEDYVGENIDERIEEMFGCDFKSKSKKWNKIVKTYNKIAYFRVTFDEVPYCIIHYDNDGKNKNTGYVYFKWCKIDNPSMEDLGDLLHEIGHIITNRDGMCQAEEEFLATQWAINNSKRFGVTFSDKRIHQFQVYIFNKRNEDIRSGLKVPPKSQLTLQKKEYNK